MPHVFRLLHFHWNSGEVDDASPHLEQNMAKQIVANFCPNGIILSQSEQTCVGLMRMVLWRRIRKSLKGQAFCVRYSRRWSSAANKHNLCRGGPDALRRPHANVEMALTELIAEKQ